MGLVEVVLEHVSVKAAVLWIVGSWVLYLVVKNVLEERKINKLGARAARMPSRLPLSLDNIIRAVRANIQNRNLQMWRSHMSHSITYTVEGRLLFQRIILTADPENIKAILATQFTDYGKGEPFHQEWKPFLGDSIFATDGEKWHTSRQMLRPQFVKDRVSDLECFESHIKTLFKAMANGGALEGEHQHVELSAINGKRFEITDLFFRFSLDVATDFLLGYDVKSLSTPHAEFAEAFNEVQHVQSTITRSGPAQALVPKGSYYRGLKVMDNFINPFIDRALRLSPDELASKTKSDHGYTFLHELASFTRDRKVLRDQIVAVLLAGRDTTAATLSWTIYELGRHPECVKRLRQEIAEVVGFGRTPTYADLKSMKYLQNVMHETLRLYPAVPFNVRLALHDTTLPRGGGPDGTLPVPVLKDTPIGYSTLLMQRRRDLYPPVSENFADPDVFSPERWFHWQPRPWQYVPFNGGPRICIGQQFALTEMGYVLVRMFQQYERVVSYMDEIDGGNPTIKADIVMQPGDGVIVAFWEGDNEKI
ncbi:hypothetical protein MCOR27_001577 [Pyricularia oryzae]|uniref:Cytochrome P450 n=5 Tax=Pyricularia TaxID=48558 RepID=A0ABQ8NKR6_PYRGI|nr:cytochrome P450 52A5 [Pyricularia oryzae 70-15]ELQ43554.1 cytochrome P450 52A5 [Pyricularia oryzae Y34]KAH8841865.1 hypothetical protein MCOR01_005815 [Pyricularia oryzae]KAI6298525.1 hypothetical protein MCOR33_005313 [Pyricularia grisea]EHA57407.1 cytochrome P450 52A5 [Pyricularia oryzae 70-15]KAH9435037.1 hypothetical protein MCOR02_003996 [Pyricularia oryzae]